MNLGWQQDKYIRGWLDPPGKPMHFMAAIGAGSLLMSAVWPGSLVCFAIPALLLLSLSVVGWCVHFVVALILEVRCRDARYSKVKTYYRWAILPLIVGGSILLWAGDVPLYATFFASKPWMDDLAQQVTSAGPTTTLPSSKQVGLFPAYRIERCGGGCRFLVQGSSLVDRFGFAYSTNGPPPVIGQDVYTHLWGPWYKWVEEL